MSHVTSELKMESHFWEQLKQRKRKTTTTIATNLNVRSHLCQQLPKYLQSAQQILVEMWRRLQWNRTKRHIHIYKYENKRDNSRKRIVRPAIDSCSVSVYSCCENMNEEIETKSVKWIRDISSQLGKFHLSNKIFVVDVIHLTAEFQIGWIWNAVCCGIKWCICASASSNVTDTWSSTWLSVLLFRWSQPGVWWGGGSENEGQIHSHSWQYSWAISPARHLSICMNGDILNMPQTNLQHVLMTDQIPSVVIPPKNGNSIISTYAFVEFWIEYFTLLTEEDFVSLKYFEVKSKTPLFWRMWKKHIFLVQQLNFFQHYFHKHLSSFSERSTKLIPHCAFFLHSSSQRNCNTQLQKHTICFR